MVIEKSLFAGFDLGTTNSVAAVFDGSDVQVVRNASGGSFTPSVVRIDGRGRVTVGEKATRFLQRDPRNTHREFKRIMGTARRIEFSDSQSSRLPEELSAEILRSLRKDVEDTTGVLPSRAVISVPALFELPQSKATAEAARIAGFEQVELLQEPIASALAAGWNGEERGAWMIYDLGGGTFDVSLLETRDGLLRVVGHDGDNFLGGRDFDRAIVDWIAKELAVSEGVQLERKNPEHNAALALLRYAAEAAKIELSRVRETELALEQPLVVDGRELEVNLTIERATLEAICAPLVARTVSVCHRLLETHGLSIDQLSRIVLVGGPAAMPIVRREVEERLQTEVASGHDPMTLVAQGAALFAATAGLDSRTATTAQRAPNARTVWCQYPPVSSDLEPYVIGRFESAGESAPTKVQLIRVEPEGPSPWASETVALDEERAFALRVELVPRSQNRFRIQATTEDGHSIPTEPREVTIIQGLTIGDPPLARSIGVALANNAVHTYFERGTALPSRRTFTHHTVETIAGRSDGCVLAIPIVQGEFDQASLCQLVGTIEITGNRVHQTIPSGTPVEITISLDRGGKLAATARVLLAEGEPLSFEGVAQLIMPEATVESLKENLQAMRKRNAEALSVAFREGDRHTVARLNALEGQLSEIADLVEALAGGDVDAGQRAARILLEVDASLSAIDAEQRWPELEGDARETFSWAVMWCSELGKESESRLLDQTGIALERAIERRNVAELTRQLRIIRRIGSACYRRDPESWVHDFDYCVSRIEETSNLAAAKKLEAKGRKAIARQDTTELRSTVEQFFTLLPSDPLVRRMSHSSGVR